MSSENPQMLGDKRLLWLDVAKLFCAVLVVAIHWLRACYKVGLFGGNDRTSLVMDYQGHNTGLQMLHYVLIAGSGLSFEVWLTNAVGFLGGFGWEAVSGFIVISGFSVTIALGRPSASATSWISWYKRRAWRILLPFYIVALPFLACYATALAVLPHFAVSPILDMKLHSLFSTPLLGIVMSHVLLFDPYGYQWSADFFSPSWWFVPAILLAYAVYPTLRFASRILLGIPLLVASAFISASSYVLSDSGVLVNQHWYFIVLNELFNFALGIVLANAWLGSHRGLIERLLLDPRVLLMATFIFVLGNLANWAEMTRPFASMLYGPSLVVMLSFAGARIQNRVRTVQLSVVDPYDLYLVHVPFGFPVALAARALFAGYGVFLGWFMFLAIAVVAAAAVSRAKQVLSRVVIAADVPLRPWILLHKR